MPAPSERDQHLQVLTASFQAAGHTPEEAASLARMAWALSKEAMRRRNPPAGAVSSMGDTGAAGAAATAEPGAAGAAPTADTGAAGAAPKADASATAPPPAAMAAAAAAKAGASPKADAAGDVAAGVADGPGAMSAPLDGSAADANVAARAADRRGPLAPTQDRDLAAFIEAQRLPQPPPAGVDWAHYAPGRATAAVEYRGQSRGRAHSASRGRGSFQSGGDGRPRSVSRRRSQSRGPRPRREPDPADNAPADALAPSAARRAQTPAPPTARPARTLAPPAAGRGAAQVPNLWQGQDGWYTAEQWDWWRSGGWRTAGRGGKGGKR